ncbi:N-acetylmuramoyl-L-alanine amidase [Cytobacillus sp. FSL R5-0596]|uniref:N-acetylmuramoyl-L-alanine amidase n=1 Tax=Cytobacillus sp. FSL R5-0596 TaxID=2954696 RepID=UPI0030F9FEC2
MKIILDAGHGSNTPGKRSPNGMKEFEFNSAVANYVKGVLDNYDCQVRFAHDTSGKIDVELSKRADLANSWGADVFVSIHANAFGNGGWNSAQGIETFAYKTKPKNATALANVIQKKLVQKTGGQNRGVKFADFAVLRETKMDAILAECGFMTNQAEASRLKTSDYRIKCAYAIAEGLIEFYKLKEKAKPKEPVKSSAKGLYKVQVGAFSDKKNADNLAAELKKKGYSTYIVHE